MKKFFLLSFSIFFVLLFFPLTLLAQENPELNPLEVEEEEISLSEEEKEIIEENETDSEEIPLESSSVEDEEGLPLPLEDEINDASENEIEEEKDSIIEAFEKTEKETEKKGYKYTKNKTVPSPIRPKKQDNSKEYLDRSENYKNECDDILKYGLDSQIASLIDELLKNEDTRFIDEIYDLFLETKSLSVKEKILDYFAHLKDPCLGFYAVEVINDPYDTKKSVVDKCFKYVSEADIKEACPGLVDLVDKEEDAYFTGALSALGEIGDKEEALFLSDYLDRTDLTVPQRQALMKVLGRIKAVETWEKISEIAQDENENSFVRMYAAEAIGAMEKKEAEPILSDLFESDDPNLRVYVVKGISYFKDEKAEDIIIQALRDGQYKVRLEAVAAVEKNEIKNAVPYLVFRCKDKDEQKTVKEKCYKVIALLNTKEGNEYLISIIKDKKASDDTKARVSSALLEFNNAGTSEVIELARATLKNDTQKNLRYALGKEFAKYDRSEFADICAEYIAHSDVATQGTGLDIWAKGRYSSVKSAVEEIAKDAEEDEKSEEESEKGKQFSVKKKNANAKKAKRILEQSK